MGEQLRQFLAGLNPLIAMFVIALAGGWQSHANGAEVQPTLSVSQDVEEVHREALAYLAAEIAHGSHDRISLKVVERSPHDSIENTIEALRRGKSQFALISLSDLGQVSRGINSMRALFVFKDLADVERFQSSDKGVQLLGELAPRGLHGLGFWHRKMYQIVSTDPIRGMKDFEDRSFDVRGDAPNREEWRALQLELGLASLKKSLEALALGASDMTEASWSDLAAFSGPNSFISGAHVLASNHRYSGFALVASVEWMNSIPVELRGVVENAAASAAQRNNARVSALDAASRQRTKSGAGVVERTLPEAERHKILSRLTRREWQNSEAIDVLDIIEMLGDTTAKAVLADAGRYGRHLKAAEQSTQRSTGQGREDPRDREYRRDRAREPTVTPTNVPKRYARLKQGPAYWRFWLERDDRETPSVDAGKNYALKLALSRHLRDHAAQASWELLQEVDTAIASGASSASLLIRPIALSADIRLSPGAFAEYPIRISLDKLGPLTHAELDASTQAYQTALDKKRPRRKVSAEFDAGSIAVPVYFTESPGCGQMLFSIWDETGTRPLDSVVVSIPVGQDDKACGLVSVQGGFNPTAESAKKSYGQADIAFTFVEFSTGEAIKTVAMLVDTKKYLASSTAASLPDRGVYVWQLQPSLSNFLSTDLPGSIAEARNDRNYSIPAAHLRVKIFSGEDAHGMAQAKLALDAFRRAVDGNKGGAVVRVRAVRANGTHLYPPLALLAAKGGVLSHRPIVIFPLPRERYMASTCIGKWTIGIPAQIDGADDQVIPTNTVLAGRMTRVKDIAGLKSYLNAQPKMTGQAGSGKQAEGVLIVAHHGNGNLWFLGNGSKLKIQPEENTKIFPPGSVAILNACSTANATDGNASLIEQFNKHGVDAIVASPFPVETSYGLALAQAITNSIYKAYVNEQQPSVVDIFQAAVNEVAAKRPDDNLSEKVLEFVLLGDTTLRLCGKKRP